jgi:hypothetical protein
MAIINLALNPQEIAPAGAGGQLPISDPKGHLVTIIGSEIKETKNGNGSFVEFELEICEGDLMGTTGKYRLNLFLTNSDKAVEIAYAQLSALCHVTGVFPEGNEVDTDVWHNIQFRAVVRRQPKQEADTDFTEVSALLHADGSKPGKGSVVQAQADPEPVQASKPPVAAKPALTKPAGFVKPVPEPAKVPWKR